MAQHLPTILIQGLGEIRKTLLSTFKVEVSVDLLHSMPHYSHVIKDLVRIWVHQTLCQKHLMGRDLVYCRHNEVKIAIFMTGIELLLLIVMGPNLQDIEKIQYNTKENCSTLEAAEMLLKFSQTSISDFHSILQIKS